MIIKPVGDYKERLNNLPVKNIINGAVTRMKESLSFLQDIDIRSDDTKIGTLRFNFKYGTQETTLQMVVTPNELFVMLYDTE